MKTLSEIKADYEKSHTEAVGLLGRHAPLFDAALNAVSNLNVIRADFTGYSLDISITGDRHALTAAFGALRRCGFSPGDDRPKAGSPSYSAFFRHESNYEACIWFSFSSTQCRRVKVGTRTVEQDVYETVCDEMVLDSKAPVAAKDEEMVF